MKALSLAFKDLQILFRDRGNLFMLFLLPLLFIVVFSGALSGVGKGEKDTRIPLAIVDLDGGKSAKALLQDLDEAGGVRVELLDRARAMERLNLAEIPRVLTIPGNLTQDVAARRQTTLRLLVHPNADLEQTDAVRRVVEGVARSMSLEIQLINALEQMREMQAGVRETSDAFTVDRMQKQARSQFERSQREPLVSIQQRAPGQPSEQDKPLGTGDVAVPSMAVLFVFLTAQQTARSIYDEKKTGTFRRLLAAPIGQAALLAGKMLPNLIVGLIQSAVIFTFGILGLRLMGLPSVSLGIEPLATVLVVALMVLCSTAFGVLIASIARTENQISGLSSLLLWGMGILGGAFIPLFIMEQVLGPLPRVVPHYWANHALTNLMVRGLGLASVAVDMVALLGFAAVFFVVGLWRFDFD